MNNNVKLITAGALAICASIAVCQAQIITNGSFEQGLNGWSVSGAADVAYYNSSDGTNAVRFNAADATPNAVLAQTFTTVPGGEYTLSFDFGSWGPFANSEQRLSVEVRGAGIRLSVFVIVQGITGTITMVPHRFSFIADSTNCTLTFRDVSLQTVRTDGHLDNVSVTGNPHPLSIRVSQVELCWPSATNFVYQVQYRSTLTTNSWVDLGAPIQGNSPTNCTNDAVAPGTPQRYYQVVLAP